jgi:2-alkenal reductase
MAMFLTSWVSGGVGGRGLRTAALVAAQATSLLIGAAGAHALSGAESPVQWLGRALAGPAAQMCEVGDTLSAADIAERVNPAVVTITNLQAFSQRGDDGDAVPVGAGSGFIIDGEGHVVTNAHVVAGAVELSVEFHDGTTVDAKVIGLDEFQDIAVIRLSLPAGVDLPGIAPLGDSTLVRPGDRVVAIGSALGEFTNTVTEGTVNAVGRSLGGYGLSNLIQHDAEIWHGNSGGPLLNMQGEVVGVNSAGISDEEAESVLDPARISFAVAINPARELVSELIVKGVVVRPYLGITGQPDAAGHLVAEVVEGGPAAVAGLEPGDLIIAIDGESLNRRTNLLERLFDHAPGDTLTLTIERDGEELAIEVVLGERPAESD